MKLRRKKVEPQGGGDPRVKVVFVENAARMVTLEDPESPLHAARGAFARIRPPEALSPEETRSWADSVRAIAKAVHVLPTRRSALLPGAPTRVGEEPIGSIRDEVYKLVGEMGDTELHGVVEGIMSEVERG